MFKRSLPILSLLLLVACQAPQSLPSSLQMPGPTLFGQQSQLRTDWFAQLSPELQSYYADARGKTGAELFAALSQIISRNNHFDHYHDAKGYVYAVSDNGPFGPHGETGVIAAYSNLFVAGKGGNGNAYRESGDANKDGRNSDFINCEHTWPQSFFNKQEPMRADMHHLFPTFSYPNNRRGHLPFGTAQEGHVVYSTANGSKLVVRDNNFLSYSSQQALASSANVDSEEVDVNAVSDAVFEPADTQKGNTARAMLYFYMRWHDANIRSGDYDARDFWVNRVPQFENWSENVDPVDDRERRRNDLIFQKQGNRNPFIDIPGLTSLIGTQALQGSEARFIQP